MRVSSASRASRVRRPGRRRGYLSAAWLVTMGLFLVALVFVFQTNLRGWHEKVELQNAADAAALAGAAALADDLVLTEAAGTRVALIGTTRRAAELITDRNRVGGQPLVLAPNPDNRIGQETFLGGLDGPRSRSFLPPVGEAVVPHRPDVNAFQVVVTRSRAAAEVTAYVDHDVVGFGLRPPTPGTAGGATLPLVPLTVLTDPCLPDRHSLAGWKTRDPRSWERQVLAREGGDDWRFDFLAGQPVPGADRLPEIVVRLGSAGGNGRIVRLGAAASSADLVRQVVQGVAYGDLQDRGGQLRLDVPNAEESAAGTGAAANWVRLAEREVSAEEVSALAEALLRIRGQPRVWLLHVETAEAPGDAVDVVGFVAARVMEVRTEGGLAVVLQPTVMNVSAALTDVRRRDLGPRTLYSPYVGKVRVVD